jgi:hypothetical protein
MKPDKHKETKVRGTAGLNERIGFLTAQEPFPWRWLRRALDIGRMAYPFLLDGPAEGGSEDSDLLADSASTHSLSPAQGAIRSARKAIWSQLAKVSAKCESSVAKPLMIANLSLPVSEVAVEDGANGRGALGSGGLLPLILYLGEEAVCLCFV